MKRIQYIFILILIYLICGSRGCNEENTRIESNKSKPLSEIKDSIKNVFAIDIPSRQVLRAFEKTAQQKLTDFGDYLKIASDSTIALNFRQQAAEMARKLFLSGKIDLQKWNPANVNSGIITLDQLLDKSISKGMPYWVQPLEMSVKMPFSWMNDSTFKGSLSFNPQYLAHKNSTVQGYKSETISIEIYACRKYKYFGQENFRLWEVFLGDLK